MPFSEPKTAQFATLFRGWNRLEARSRKDDFSSGLAAATADPLWALGRQWQMQELKGRNAGTPIRADVTYEVAALNEIRLGDQPFEDIDETPVEVQVERESVEWDWRMRIRAGQHFERMAPDLVDQMRDLCPVVKPPEDSEEWINLDYASRRFVLFMEGRAINGETLFELIAQGAVPEPFAGEMTRWYGSLYWQPGRNASPAWKPERLDYEFALRAGAPAAPGSLKAGSYRNGSIDWHSFVTDGSAAAAFKTPAVLRATPVHVTFAGQPKPRWWEFEDGAVNFGALDTAKTDLGKLLLTEFALMHGDDWFIVPLRTDPNTLINVREVRVLDCFGVQTPIARAVDAAGPLQKWQVYALAPAPGTAQPAAMLYVPPGAGTREESPVLEEVQFARDEDANIVFAIEHIVPNQLGDPARGFAAHLEAQRRWREHLGTEAEATSAPTAEPAPDAPPPPRVRYVMSTKVPQNWIPFLATEGDNTVGGVVRRSVRLREGAIVSTEAADELRPIAALSRLLSRGDGAANLINEEAVGRAGVRVELRRQRMRSATGETHVWLGRKVGVGKGEARSGLRFDEGREIA